MFARWLVSWSLAATAFVGTGLGLPVPQDDAGTGLDAPGQMSQALGPLAPGAYSGTTVKSVDESDWYRFTAAAADVAWIEFQPPAGSALRMQLWGPNDLHPSLAVPYAQVGVTSSPTPVPFVLHAAGDWAFQVSYHISDPNPAGTEHAYGFSFRVEAGSNPVLFHSGAPAAHFEAAWDEPTDVVLTVSFGAMGEFGAANAMAIQVQYGGGLKDRLGAGPGFLLGQNGIEDDLTLHDPAIPLGVDQPLPDSSTDASPAHQGVGGFYTRANLVGVTGSLRISTMAHAQHSALRIGIDASGPSRQASWVSDDLVVWEYGETADAMVGAPFAAQTSSHVRDLVVEGRFLGVAKAAPGATLDYRAPGQEWHAGNPALQVLRDLQEGTWSFRYGPDTSTGMTSPNALVGVFTPDLGVFQGDAMPYPAG